MKHTGFKFANHFYRDHSILFMTYGTKYQTSKSEESNVIKFKINKFSKFVIIRYYLSNLNIHFDEGILNISRKKTCFIYVRFSFS